ncbi:MAG: hypothetical protein RPU13_04675 [Candidatus Sedimenticola sp. (ex Thyasira tokunagai)]
MQRKVLIVEDEPDISRLVQEHLADIGCDADIAGDGGSAAASHGERSEGW